MYPKILFSAKFRNILSFLPFSRFLPHSVIHLMYVCVCAFFCLFSLTAMCRPISVCSATSRIVFLYANTETEILSNSHVISTECVYFCLCANECLTYSNQSFLHHHFFFLLYLTSYLSNTENEENKRCITNQQTQLTKNSEYRKIQCHHWAHIRALDSCLHLNIVTAY